VGQDYVRQSLSRTQPAVSLFCGFDSRKPGLCGRPAGPFPPAAVALASPALQRGSRAPGSLQKQMNTAPRVTESQNHRIVGVGRDLWGSSSPTLKEVTRRFSFSWKTPRRTCCPRRLRTRPCAHRGAQALPAAQATQTQPARG